MVFPIQILPPFLLSHSPFVRLSLCLARQREGEGIRMGYREYFELYER